MISFTGSTAVGRRIGSVAGEGMTRLLLELGGKGAAIIFDDADVGRAIMGIGSHLGLPLRPDLHRARPGSWPSGASMTRWWPA